MALNCTGQIGYQIGYQEKLFQGKGCRALEQAAKGTGCIAIPGGI